MEQTFTPITDAPIKLSIKRVLKNPKTVYINASAYDPLMTGNSTFSGKYAINNVSYYYEGFYGDGAIQSSNAYYKNVEIRE